MTNFQIARSIIDNYSVGGARLAATIAKALDDAERRGMTFAVEVRAKENIL